MQVSPEVYRVRVLDRIVAILECFTIDNPELGVGELARELDLNKATVHRLLSSLESHRLVQQNPVSKRYRLGFRIYDLGQRVLARLNNVEFAEPHLERLSLEVGETAHLAILDDGMAYYVAKVESQRSLRMPSQVGKRIPTHCTAVGKTLLAAQSSADVDRIVAQHGLVRMTERTIVDRSKLEDELTRIRERGWALDNEEIEDGLRCVAAPVRDHTGSVAAAVSVSGPTARFTDEAIPRVAETVISAAVAISEALGDGRPRSDLPEQSA
jgi:DNA-binding IclR family transcriptional regulator